MRRHSTGLGQHPVAVSLGRPDWMISTGRHGADSDFGRTIGCSNEVFAGSLALGPPGEPLPTHPLHSVVDIADETERTGSPDLVVDVQAAEEDLPDATSGWTVTFAVQGASRSSAAPNQKWHGRL